MTLPVAIVLSSVALSAAYVVGAYFRRNTPTVAATVHISPQGGGATVNMLNRSPRFDDKYA